MKRQGFTPTTAILIVLLLGAVVWVGKIVNPPPPGPPADAPPVKQASSSSVTPPTPQSPMKKGFPGHQPTAETADDKKLQERMKMNRAMAGNKGKSAPPVKKFDPNTIVTDNSYFKENPDGDKGIKIMQQKVAEAKAEQEKERAAHPAAHPTTSSAPPASAPPTR